MRCRAASVIAIFIGALALAAHVRALDWWDVTSPAPGPAQVFGGFAAACIRGAVPLADGVGYQPVDLGRERYYGHPSLIAFIQSLGRRAHAAGLGTVLIGDMAQPRGGPMSYGHVSHQSGLDVDIWYRLDVGPLPRDRREGLEEIRFVREGRVDARIWTDRHAALVQLAASDPRVTRVFVDAAIKRDLCDRQWPDRSWLRRVRPYPRHDDHMHVRLRCPDDSPRCVEQRPPPIDEGCGLIANPPEARLPHRPRSHPLPNICRALLELPRP